MFEKRRCHFTHIFELFARYIYVIVVTVITVCLNLADAILRDEEFVSRVKRFLGGEVSAEGVMILVAAGILLAVSALMLLYCAFRWRYTFVSAEENTLIYETGKFLKKRVAIPFEKINTIDMGRNLFERLVGTCRLKIDTGAYSTSQEKNQSEMNLVFTLAEADEIRGYILRRAEADADAEAALGSEKNPIVSKEPDWVIRAGAGDFILYGLTSSSVWKLFWMIVLGVMCVAELAEGLLAQTAEAVLPFAEDAIETVTQHNLFTLVLLLAAVYLGTAIVSDVYTMVWASIRFYGFRVAREGRSVIVRYGLITEKNYTLQVRNIHALIVRQNLFQQMLGRCSVEAVCMGFGDEKDETALLLPIIKQSKLNALLGVILPEYVTEMNIRPRKRAGLLFHAVLPVVIWAAVCAGICAVCAWLEIPKALPVALSVVAVAVRLLSGVLAYRNTALDWNERVVSVQCGGLIKRVYRIRTDAVQEVQVNTDLIKRLFGIGTYYVHYHGPTFNNTSIAPHLSDAFFAELADTVED